MVAGATGWGRRRRGAAGPSPAQNSIEPEFYKTYDLERLVALAETLIVNDEVPEGTESGRIQDMVPFRISVGGSRPKAVVENSERLWLAKFKRGADRINHARIERAMLELAEICGIRCARSCVETVGGRDVLLVERFGRDKTDLGYLRSRMVSGFTMLRTDATSENRKGWRYAKLAEEMRRIIMPLSRNARNGSCRPPTIWSQGRSSWGSSAANSR